MRTDIHKLTERQLEILSQLVDIVKDNPEADGIVFHLYWNRTEELATFLEGFCDHCHYLHPKEHEQVNHEQHKCTKLNRILPHRGHHPRIPRPCNCPLLNKENA